LRQRNVGSPCSFATLLKIADEVFDCAQTIGERVATNEATVVRTANARGYSGLPELKRAAAAALSTSLRLADVLGSRLQHVDTKPESLMTR
jgi:DNA-binding MurR/RpiR family transcriptional regulator